MALGVLFLLLRVEESELGHLPGSILDLRIVCDWVQCKRVRELFLGRILLLTRIWGEILVQRYQRHVEIGQLHDVSLVRVLDYRLRAVEQVAPETHQVLEIMLHSSYYF